MNKGRANGSHQPYHFFESFPAACPVDACVCIACVQPQGQHWKQAQLFIWQPDSPAAKGLHTAITHSPSLLRGISQGVSSLPSVKEIGIAKAKPALCHEAVLWVNSAASLSIKALGTTRSLLAHQAFAEPSQRGLKWPPSLEMRGNECRVNWSCLAGEKPHCRWQVTSERSWDE